MANDKITMKEKENPPRIKEEYSTLSITITCDDPDVIIAPAAQKPATLKFPMPLVEKIEGPFDENDKRVEELEIGKTYIYKATKFKESTFTPIKHIWFAEQLDDGKITDLEYKKGENPYLDAKGIVCFKYTVKECEKIRIYAYVAKPIKSVSVENSVLFEDEVISLIFNSNSREIDDKIDEYKEAIDLVLPKISTKDDWTFDGLIDAYSEIYNDEQLAQLLYVFSPEDQGAGLGYEVAKSDFWIDNYSIDHEKKIIYLDSDETFSNFSNEEAAHSLNKAIIDIGRHIAYESESFWGTVWRVTKGIGITVIGGVEMIVGGIGVIAPEPATSVGGALLAGYGASTAGEGISMIFGANEGDGYNLIEEGFAKIGNAIDTKDGDSIARGAFLVTNIVVSLGGSYKILKVPNSKFIMKGTYTGKDFAKYYREGYTLGRLQLNYTFTEIVNGVALKGRVLINVTNNSNGWIFRFQTIGGKLVMNGRIFGVQKWHRLSSKKEMLKILIKLAKHGFKKGL